MRLINTKLVYLIVILLVCLHGAMFLSGFLLTADEISWNYISLQGWISIWNYISGVSINQGRIVQYIDLPFSMLSSYFADILSFRVFYTALYFFNFILLGKYLSYFFQIRITELFVIVMLAFHPLEFFHLPPTSYPAHITFPIFCILLSRLKLIQNNYTRNPLKETLWRLCYFFGLLFNEYSFIFGSCLYFIESMMSFINMYTKALSYSKAFQNTLRSTSFKKDGLIIMLWMILYVGYRIIYPSTYNGNQIVLPIDISAFIKTTFGHILGGTSLFHIVRNFGKILLEGNITYDHGLSLHMLTQSINYLFKVLKLTLAEWAYFVSTMLLTFFASMYFFKNINKEIKTLKIYNIKIIGILGVFTAVIVTIPLSLVVKYQEWCDHIYGCAYLDSRISYLGIGITVISLLLIIIYHFQNNKFYSTFIFVFSFFISLSTSLTFLSNIAVSRKMTQYSQSWKDAKTLKGISESEIDKLNLKEILDSNNLIPYPMDPQEYWKLYITKSH